MLISKIGLFIIAFFSAYKGIREFQTDIPQNGSSKAKWLNFWFVVLITALLVLATISDEKKTTGAIVINNTINRSPQPSTVNDKISQTKPSTDDTEFIKPPIPIVPQNKFMVIAVINEDYKPDLSNSVAMAIKPKVKNQEFTFIKTTNKSCLDSAIQGNLNCLLGNPDLLPVQFLVLLSGNEKVFRNSDYEDIYEFTGDYQVLVYDVISGNIVNSFSFPIHTSELDATSVRFRALPQIVASLKAKFSTL